MGRPTVDDSTLLDDTGEISRLDAPPTEFIPDARPGRAGPPLPRADATLMRWAIGLVAALALARAASLLPGIGQAPADARMALIAADLGLALIAAACLRVPRAALSWALGGVFSLAVVVAVFTAAAYGWRLSAPSLGLLGILVAASSLAAGARVALWVAAAGMAAALVLALAPTALPLAAATEVLPPPGLRLAGFAMTIGAGLLCGWAFARIVSHRQRAADEREARFAGLLALAVDAYWEIDAQYRLVAVRDPRDSSVEASLAGAIGEQPWELPQFMCDPDVLDALRADLETRVAFRDLPLQWQSRRGALRFFAISGEPRFDERGLFRGYWGVAREYTASVRAQEALRATETRYVELFARIPTPLVLHRDGVIIDANPAAVQLFGYESLDLMIGRDILENHESGDSRERGRRRLEQLEAMPVGEALPVTDYRLLARNGRRISVRGTGVRVAADGGPATLSMFVDDTERRRAEEAVRRSEALLSHLVATSPDVITLTDLATGRYAMVNHTFERITGYRSAEVVGHTSIELGIWADARQREELINLVRQNGTARDVPCDFVTKGGQTVQLLVSSAVFAMDRRTYLVINGRDISAQERSRLERDAILENAWVGIAVTRDRHFVLSNPRFDEMYGWPRGAIVGQPGSAVWPSVEDYAAIGAEAGPPLARGEVVEFERLASRRDGGTFMARVVAKAIDPTRATKGGTIWIIEDVTEKHHVAEALARARDAAEAANRAKSAFLANTSHELRTPLNGMLGLAQLARDPQTGEERRRYYLDQIVDNAQALAAIISDVLDLSKIEAGKLVLESTSFNVGAMLAQLRQTCSAFAVGRDIELRFDIDPALQGHASGDPLRLRQILSNYLTNALKFTDRGVVRLVARRLDTQRVHFEVHDSGPGIDEATQARLFRPFTQADESTTRRFGGTGLGLSICRELAQLMGGEVGVASRLGAGACFWVELALPAIDAPPEPPPEPPPQDLQGLRVLIVEDNPVNMLIGVAMLEQWGVSVVQAGDGRQAVAAVQRACDVGESFDAVLMDVQMPVMSGHEAAREIRRLPCGARLPIIALTAAALVGERELAIQAGMDDFLTKPIDADRLRAAIGRWAAVH